MSVEDYWDKVPYHVKETYDKTVGMFQNPLTIRDQLRHFSNNKKILKVRYIINFDSDMVKL